MSVMKLHIRDLHEGEGAHTRLYTHVITGSRPCRLIHTCTWGIAFLQHSTHTCHHGYMSVFPLSRCHHGYMCVCVQMHVNCIMGITLHLQLLKTPSNSIHIQLTTQWRVHTAGKNGTNDTVSRWVARLHVQSVPLTCQYIPLLPFSPYCLTFFTP